MDDDAARRIVRQDVDDHCLCFHFTMSRHFLGDGIYEFSMFIYQDDEKEALLASGHYGLSA